MKAHYLSSSQKSMVKAEARRQFIAAQDDFGKDFDAVVLWVLHEKFGFGQKRLKMFYDCFNELYKELKTLYQLGSDTPFVARKKLEQIGINLDKWQEEVNYDD